MYDTLCRYARECIAAAPDNRWDGIVPRKYMTSGDSPKALEKWVNRQKSAYGNVNLK
jgi:hypothetical protein